MEKNRRNGINEHFFLVFNLEIGLVNRILFLLVSVSSYFHLEKNYAQWVPFQVADLYRMDVTWVAIGVQFRWNSETVCSIVFKSSKDFIEFNKLTHHTHLDGNCLSG